MSVRERLARYRAAHAQGGAETRVPQNAPYSGTPDEPGGMDPPWYADPLNYIPVPGAQTGAGRAVGTGLSEAARPVLSEVGAAAGRVARPVLGGIGGAISHAPIIGPMIRGAAKGFAAGSKAAAGSAASRVAVEGASDAAMKPLVGGAEAAAYREGGMPAVEALRSQATQAVEDIPKGFHKVTQKAGEFLRKNAKRAPKGKVAGEIKPKLGSAASRIAKPAAKAAEKGPAYTHQPEKLVLGLLKSSRIAASEKAKIAEEALKAAKSKGLEVSKEVMEEIRKVVGH